MKKGRSTYTFQLNCDPNVANNLVQAYIQGNQFELKNNNGKKYYRSGDAILRGYRYFDYCISGQQLTIYAWFKGSLGEIPIEQNSLNIMAMTYRKSLNTLFEEIQKLNNGGVIMNNNMNFDPNTGQPINPNYGQQQNQGYQQPINLNYGQQPNQGYQQPINPNYGQQPNQGYQQPMNPNYNQGMQQNNQFVQNFQDETIKKQEKMCEWGFWLSILGLLASFVGVAYGVIVYILNFYFASQGLKTSKRNKAIATIAISIISIIIIILQIASA